MSSSDSDTDNEYYNKWSKVVDGKLTKSKINLSLCHSRKRKLSSPETPAGQETSPVTPLLVSHGQLAADTQTGDDLFPPVTPLLDNLQGLQSSVIPLSTTCTEIPPVTESLDDLLLGHSDDIVSPIPSHTQVHTEMVSMVHSTSPCEPLSHVYHFDDSTENDRGDHDYDLNDHHDNDEYGVNKYNSFDELAEAVETLEVESVTCCNAKTSTQGFDTNTDLQMYLSTIKSEKDIRLLWQNKGKDDNTPIEFNGTPFVLLNKRLYTCHQGKDRNKEKK